VLRGGSRDRSRPGCTPASRRSSVSRQRVDAHDPHPRVLSDPGKTALAADGRAIVHALDLVGYCTATRIELGVQSSWPCTPLRATAYDLRTGLGPSMRRCMHSREEDHGALIGAVGVSVGAASRSTAPGRTGRARGRSVRLHHAPAYPPDIIASRARIRRPRGRRTSPGHRRVTGSRHRQCAVSDGVGCSPVFQGCGHMPPIPQMSMAVGDHAAAVGARRRPRRPAVPRLRASPTLVRKRSPTSTSSLRRLDEPKRYKHPIDMRGVGVKNRHLGPKLA
jgi:hypothetical protein